MNSDHSFKFNQIKRFLSISELNNELESNLGEWVVTDDFKLEVLSRVLNFIFHFAMFKEIGPFMKSLFTVIKKTFKNETDSLPEFEQLLIKNTLTRFIQEYITYTKISQKEKVLDYLTQSLGKLQLQPLIINLGLLIKPMYEDESYVKKIEEFEEVEVAYVLNSEEEIQIKRHIDNWLECQNISLDNQDILKGKLKVKFDELILTCDLSIDSEECSELWKEVCEMLNLKLTVLSLMQSFPEEEFEPIGIK